MTVAKIESLREEISSFIGLKPYPVEKTPTIKLLGRQDNLQHLRMRGSHELDKARFQKIIDWMVKMAN